MDEIYRCAMCEVILTPDITHRGPGIVVWRNVTPAPMSSWRPPNIDMVVATVCKTCAPKAHSVNQNNGMKVSDRSERGKLSFCPLYGEP